MLYNIYIKFKEVVFMYDYNNEEEYKVVEQEEQTEPIVLASNVKLTKEEREFYLNYSELDGVWVAETSIPKFWRKLEKKNWKCTGVQYYPDGQVCSKTFTSGNSKGISITDPTKVRVMSEENIEKSRQRFIAMHNANNSEVTEEEDNDE